MEYRVKQTESSRLHDRLGYPVIDTDGHIFEEFFCLDEFLKDVGGPSLVERFHRPGGFFTLPGQSPKIVPWPQFSGAHTLDRATYALPKLYALRLEEAGVDFSTLFPTLGFRCQVMEDDELRQASCRALNMMYAEIFRDVRDRMTPAAVIPMVTPDEAIAELEFAVKQLGFKAIMTANEVVRTPQVVSEKAPELEGKVREYTPLAIDSPYDYSPFWAKCLELKVVPAGHSMPFIGTHQSPVNYVYNRLGFWMTYGHAAARAIFLSGTTQKFPGLNFAFLEGGVWWGVALFNDLVEFWQKRNVEALLEYHDPSKIDITLMEQMFRRHGGGRLSPDKMLQAVPAQMRMGRTASGEVPASIDDWTQVSIRSKDDIRKAFAGPFYFGCEADDSLNYTAFNAKANQMGVKLKAMFSSDLGHWDVEDIGDVLHEAHEQVDRGLMSEEDFRDFVFVNPATLQTRVNPDFFKGTVVEGAVESLLKQQKAA